MKKRYFFAFVGLLFFSCQNGGDANTKNAFRKETILGNYVTADYEKRSEGYDWVGVTINKLSDSLAIVTVRSRADKKKATCTFDANGFFNGVDTVTAIFEGKTIFFVGKGTELTVSTANKADSNLLNYFCSGGASLAGSYHKINQPLDKYQVDNPTIIK